MSTRQTTEITVKISYEDRIKLENALENHDNAVELVVYTTVPPGYRGFASWMINMDEYKWVPDGPFPEPTLLDELEWNSYVRVNPWMLNLQLENAPGEWMQFPNDGFRYSYNPRFHYPSFTEDMQILHERGEHRQLGRVTPTTKLCI